MSYQDLILEVKQLPLEERLQMLETLTRSVREELVKPTQKKSSLARVRGMLKPDVPLVTNEDFHDDYVQYLTEKYS